MSSWFFRSMNVRFAKSSSALSISLLGVFWNMSTATIARAAPSGIRQSAASRSSPLYFIVRCPATIAAISASGS